MRKYPRLRLQKNRVELARSKWGASAGGCRDIRPRELFFELEREWRPLRCWGLAPQRFAPPPRAARPVYLRRFLRVQACSTDPLPRQCGYIANAAHTTKTTINAETRAAPQADFK